MRQKQLSTIIALQVALAFIVLISLAGCAAQRSKLYAVDHAKANVSENCVRITDTIAYYKISGFLFSGDAVKLWKDIQYLKDTDVRIIEIYLDSPGGDPYTAFAYVDIINKAKRFGFTVNIKVYGHVMSAGVPIIVVGSYRTAGRSTGFMMHKPYIPETAPYGYSEEVWDMMKESINSVFKIYAQIIADHTKLSVQEAKEMLIIKGVYFNAYRALEMGFIDEIV